MSSFRADDNPPSIWPGDEIADLAASGGIWFLIQTNHNREKKAAWELLEKGVGFYIPLVKHRDEHRNTRLIPLWPRYIFAVLPMGVCTDLRSKHIWKAEAIAEDWLVVKQLSYLKTKIDSGEIKCLSDLEPGDHCRITDGPWKGYEADIDRIDHRREIAFLTRLMGNSEAEIPLKFVEAA
jgi:hypothetical protein